MSGVIDRMTAAMLKVNEQSVGLTFTQLNREMARAALSAIREPSEEQIEAYRDSMASYEETWRGQATETWQVMIDAALSEVASK